MNVVLNSRLGEFKINIRMVQPKVSVNSEE